MAQDTTIAVPAATWTQLTDADVSSITFVNDGPGTLFVKVTTADAPTDKTGAVGYPPGAGERNVALTDLAPGVASGDRVWAWADVRCTVSVSHG